MLLERADEMPDNFITYFDSSVEEEALLKSNDSFGSDQSWEDEETKHDTAWPYASGATSSAAMSMPVKIASSSDNRFATVDHTISSS